MSSCVKFLLRSTYLVVLGLSFNGMAVPTAPERATLKIEGEPIERFGNAHCKPGDKNDKVEIVLSPKVLKDNSDFRATFVKIKNKQEITKVKPETECPKSIGNKNTEDIKKFTAVDPFIAFAKEGSFLPKSACEEKGSGDEGARVLCIYDDGGDDLLAYAPFSYNTKVATLDGITDISAVNGEIRFKVNYAGTANVTKFETCYGKTSTEPMGDDKCLEPYKTKTTSSAEVTISGLTDGEEYQFKVRLLETSSNPSKWSKIEKRTPIPASYPLLAYNGKGGVWQYQGCSQSGSFSMLLIFMVGGILLLMRARIRCSKGFTSLSVVLITCFIFNAESGHAEFGQMNFGLSGGVYRPGLDGEIGKDNKPIYPFYRCFFRSKKTDQDGKITPLMGLEFDWHLWDGFGSLQLGFGASYTYARGQAVKLVNGQPDCGAPIENATVALHMYQLRPQLTYIFDPFKEYVPLVPYIRAGLIGHGYNFTPADRMKAATVKANGLQVGYFFSTGMMLMLDFLEPASVTAARSGEIFQHVYLKGELSYTKIDSFGFGGLQFSPKDIMGTGLPLMWTFGLVFELP